MAENHRFKKTTPSKNLWMFTMGHCSSYWLGYVVNNHGKRLAPLRIGLWVVMFPFPMAQLRLTVQLLILSFWDDTPRCKRNFLHILLNLDFLGVPQQLLQPAGQDWHIGSRSPKIRTFFVSKFRHHSCPSTGGPILLGILMSPFVVSTKKSLKFKSRIWLLPCFGEGFFSLLTYLRLGDQPFASFFGSFSATQFCSFKNSAIKKKVTNYLEVQDT